ncbi:PKD domain-containing protein [Micrococcus lylae]|uniref:PKD domain-containing protein n=1 Tax=Micrococcus lylae TaxID=1273 RepID=UPI003EBA0FB7
MSKPFAATTLTLVALTASMALMTAAPSAFAETNFPKCQKGEIDAKVHNKKFLVGQDCKSDGRADFSNGPARNGYAKKSQSKKKPSHIQVSYVDGCYQDQLMTPDLRDCNYQLKTFCGEGRRWIRRMEVNTRIEENKAGSIVYGPRVCVDEDGNVVPGAGQESFDLNDVAGLITVPPRLHADNGGRGIRHAHTNFYTDAIYILQNSTLNGEPALIRATPIEYHWDYGDGTTRTTEVAGSSQSEFNVETATSHQYEETGTYTVTLSTVYMGEYSLDGGQTWIPIDGTISRESDPLQADIFRTVTRNVADDCVENPSAWGCGAPGEDSDPAR